MHRTPRAAALTVVSSLAVLVACGKKDAPADTAATPSASAPAPVASSSAPPAKSAIPLPAVPPPNPADAATMRTCCAAVRGEATKTPAKKADWEQAAKICDALAERIAHGASTLPNAVSSLRAAAAKAGPLPATCK